MELSLIAAIGRDGVIGNQGGLPWPKIKADLKRFKEITIGKAIIMGKKTHESIGDPLPQRINIVVSKSMGIITNPCQDISIVGSVTEAIEIAEGRGVKEAVFIGGQKIYQEALALVSKIHLTVIDGDFEGDVYFPLDLWKISDWELENEEKIFTDQETRFKLKFRTYRRRE